MSLPVFFESPRRSRAVPVATRLCLIKAFLAVCALTLLLPSPSRAQSLSDFYHHQWAASYTSQGVSGHGYLDNMKVNPDVSKPWLEGSNGGSSYSTVAFGEVNHFSHGTVTATLIWYPANKDIKADPPPKTVYIRETATAEERPGRYMGPDSARPNTAGALDNSFGGPVTVTGSGLWQTFTRTGTRLLQRDGSSGTIVLDPVSLSALTPTTNTAPLDWVGDGSTSVRLNVDIDTRAVSISSSFEPTSHKDINTSQPVLNTPAPDGTMGADTVSSNVDAAGANYTAHVVGAWSDNSTYHWYSSLTNRSSEGTFTLPNDPPLDFGFLFSEPGQGGLPLSIGEHINLHCVDGGISPEASANYYVTWHDEFEDWIIVVDNKQYGPLERVTIIYRPATNDAKFGRDVETSAKITMKATGEGALDIGKVATKFGVELGAEYETINTTKVEYTMVANKANWLERQTFWQHREGTVDNYGLHGYLGLLQWTLDSAYNPGTPTIDFDEYQRFSDSDPVN